MVRRTNTNGGPFILPSIVMDDYININRELWNAKTDIHVNSAFYDIESFLQGKSSLRHIEIDLLGEIKGKSILHLQCHFGQDSISLARMGAQVTGIDLSNKSIDAARGLAEKAKLPVRFINCDLYDTPNHIDGQFDIVFTSYGTIGWLPDIDKWASVIRHFLKPGGRFIFVEFHPVRWMYDDDYSKIEWSYFNRGIIIEELEGTYTDRDAPIKKKSASWNHSLSEVIGSLLKHGLSISHFKEYDYSAYACFNNVVRIGEEHYQIKGVEGKIPLMYSLVATG